MMNEMNYLGEFLKRNSTKRKIVRKVLGNIRSIFTFSVRFSYFLQGINPNPTDPNKTQSKAKLKTIIDSMTTESNSIIHKQGPKNEIFRKRNGGVKSGR